MKKIAFSATLSVLGLLGFASLAQAVPQPSVILFDTANLQGRSLTLFNSTRSLVNQGFDERTSSFQVNGGVWELCEDSIARGNCRTFGPGFYPDMLPNGLNDKAISSLRLVPAQAATLPISHPQAAVVLYEGNNFQGRSLAVNAGIPFLTDPTLRKIVSSLRIQTGYWQVCEESDYQGHCQILGPGNYANDGAIKLRNNAISSLRPVALTATTPAVTLYPNTDFQGASRSLTMAQSRMGAAMPATVASMVVQSGAWQLCEAANFTGTCHTFVPGRYGQMPQMGLPQEIGSLRPVDLTGSRGDRNSFLVEPAVWVEPAVLPMGLPMATAPVAAPIAALEQVPVASFAQQTEAFWGVHRAKNLARQMAEIENGGLQKYRAENAMHGFTADSPVRDQGTFWVFTFKGGAPGFTQPTIESEIDVQKDTFKSSVVYNGPIRQPQP